MGISLFNGRYAGNLSYGNEVAGTLLRTASRQYRERPLSHLPAIQNPPSAVDDCDAGYGVAMDSGGTGGLQGPGVSVLMAVRTGLCNTEPDVANCRSRRIPDLIFHARLSNRSLPALPPGSRTRSLRGDWIIYRCLISRKALAPTTCHSTWSPY